ncbi:hypothetical protein VHEMI03159 [[Torrubiella] hemipterigena]|uniref:Cell wall protein n=1 Tax=[Torrubiella] hemipterigena TaxID=1531966 RepID=A0A0A1TAG0_9HYPO|nr:hypothetical protein VHEMI03159 [[Torrubiella] hemipterigena]
MKLSVITLASVASASLVARDAAPYQAVINSITANITNLDIAINSYTSDKTPVFKAFDTLLDAIKQGKTTLQGLPALEGGDTFGLTGPLQTLNSDAQKLNSDLKSKRSTVAKEGECDSVRQSLTDISTNAGDLVKIAVSKIPKGLQSLADTLSSNFTSTLKDTQDYFSSTNCVNGQTSVPSGSTPSATDKTSPSATGTKGTASPSSSGGASTLQIAVLLAAAAIAFAI